MVRAIVDRDITPTERLIDGLGDDWAVTAGIDADVLIADPYVPTVDAELAHGGATDLETLLADSDVVILTPELTDETRGVIGAPELEAMRSSAILVNVSHGPVVDEHALADALAADRIAGAGLDVFTEDPPTRIRRSWAARTWPQRRTSPRSRPSVGPTTSPNSSRTSAG